jgi:hypothetical protein
MAISTYHSGELVLDQPLQPWHPSRGSSYPLCLLPLAMLVHKKAGLVKVVREAITTSLPNTFSDSR